MKTYYIGTSLSGTTCVRTRRESLKRCNIMGEPIKIRADDINEAYRIARDTMTIVNHNKRMIAKGFMP